MTIEEILALDAEYTKATDDYLKNPSSMNLERMDSACEDINRRALDTVELLKQLAAKIEALEIFFTENAHQLQRQSKLIERYEEALTGFIEAWSYNESPDDMYKKCDKACETARKALGVE